jgi:molybdenum cofactor biosynthesis enzyme MoaA
MLNQDKNRTREAPTFANINLLGKCNADCYFCLGKDIELLLSKHDQTKVHFSQWDNFEAFLRKCRETGIVKLYITGQNTDSLLYRYLGELIDHLQRRGFSVGLRTNGYLAVAKMGTINTCLDEVGYSVPSLQEATAQKMMGKPIIPDWESIFSSTVHPRAQVVVTRHNIDEFFEIIRFLSKFPNIPYIQARRVSTDTRRELLQPDIDAYEKLYTKVAASLPLHRRIWGDAEEYIIDGKPVCFWRTVKTSIGSFNYFTDGTVSDEYFVVEGYLKNMKVGTQL